VASRIGASRLEGPANRTETVPVTLFTDWFQADAARDVYRGDYLAKRVPEPLARVRVAINAAALYLTMV